MITTELGQPGYLTIGWERVKVCGITASPQPIATKSETSPSLLPTSSPRLTRARTTLYLHRDPQHPPVLPQNTLHENAMLPAKGSPGRGGTTSWHVYSLSKEPHRPSRLL